ncbi:hypothetical protein GGR51DRAFT_528761 [Nemania sp. FL0031]|nr:hypothetical protein GGR51DRAFT_528761 [Nemania sp. FL0031]
MSSITSKAVTQEQHNAVMAEILKESPDFVIIREAPAADVRRAKELLGLAEGKFTGTVLRFAKGDECCQGCGRQFNVLDMITAALKIHSSDFIKDIMFGDGIIGMSYDDLAGNNKVPICADCGQHGPGSFEYVSHNYHWYNERLPTAPLGLGLADVRRLTLGVIG